MIHIHCHSDYSNLRLIDCINKIPKLIDRAVELGNKGVAITDHESVSGHVEALRYVREGKKKGKIPNNFRLILGNEIYLVNEIHDTDTGGRYCNDYFHFILLAKDEIGHRQLRELSSLAWDNSFRTGKMERVPTLKRDLERVIRDNPGHLIASTACLGGELPKAILGYMTEGSDLPFDDENLTYKKAYDEECRNKAYQFIDYCKNIFGQDFYLELQPSSTEEQIIVNKELVRLSKEKCVPFIITCDAHYLQKEDRIYHESFLKSHEEEREVGDFYATTYMMTCDEIHEYMDEHIGSETVSEGLKNTLVIREKIKEYDLFCPTIVPAADIPDFELNHTFEAVYEQYEYIGKFAYSEDVFDRYLLYLIENGFYEKAYYEGISKEELHKLAARINIELSEMWKVTEKIKTSISSYYLTTLELIDIMWNEGDSLIDPGRGSVTGMYTMYLIGITQMNPIQWNLPHWRHISHQKAELSDVDIDTCSNRRTQIIEAIKRKKGERKVLNCCTFKTEGSRSAILTAGRGMGIDNDTLQYIANMIPITRGANWSLNDCINGNIEEERKPVREFITECSRIEGLLETAMSIEGLISGRSIHASAVYLFNEDFLEHNARMKAPNGSYITQFSMKDSDHCSGLKMDLLTIKALDIVRYCMDMLIKAGYMEWQGSLRATYNKYLHPDVLDYDTPEMWDLVAENKVMDLFQFDTDVGLQAVKRIRPHNLIELATANSIMRLMVTELGAEQPIDTYIRYKNDINQWYSCMRDDYHLTEDEIKIVEPYLLPVYGVGDTQEIVMELSMDEHIAGFDVAYSNKLRKGISKKNKELQVAMKIMFFEHGKEIGTSENLLSYIWKEVIGKQLGYSFSKNHTFPYSALGLIELNLAYHYPIIYWNTACLIVDAGAEEEVEDNKSTQYGVIATAVSNMQKRGINIALPLINTAEFGFVPDEENNRIIYSLKAINGIGDEVVRLLIQNRPYVSMRDFCERMIVTKLVKSAQMVKLIKAGCFTELDNIDRRKTMYDFIEAYLLNPSTGLNFQNFAQLKVYDAKYHIVPDDVNLALRHRNFRDYVLDEFFFNKIFIDKNSKRALPKCGYNDRLFVLNEVSMPFFQQYYTEDSVVEIQGENYVISEKKFKKENDKYTLALKNWLASPDTLKIFNDCKFRELWESNAEGTTSKWEMESLSFYNEPHELIDFNELLYGVVNYFELPEDPEVYSYYTRTIKQKINGMEANVQKQFPKYKIVRLAGTILDKDKNKHRLTLLTKYGVVNVKYNAGQFQYYDKTISEVQADGKKKTLEKSWFTRGNKIMVCGYRSDSQFRVYKYADSIYKHSTCLITEMRDDGSVMAATERVRVKL